MAFDNLQDKLSKALRNLSGKGKLSDKNMEDTLKEIRVALLEADVNYGVVKDFLTRIKEEAVGKEVLKNVEPGQALTKIVHDELINLLGEEEALSFNELGLTSYMFVGLQGTGKTTQAAKVASYLKNKLNKKSLLIAADVIRPAAIEQLKTLGKEIGVDVYTASDNVAITAVKEGLEYAKKNHYDVCLIDTAGRLQIDEALMSELEEIKAIAKQQEILLTVDALTGQDIVNVASSFHERLNVTGLVVTKFDGDSRGGGVLSVRAITGVPVKFLGTGEKMDDFEVFHPERLADRILGMGDVVTLVEKAQEKIDMEEAEKAAQRLLSGQFTMDDLLHQIEQTTKLGPLSGLMKMMPGQFGDVAKAIDDDAADKQFKKTKAIIQSMTKEERENPSIIMSGRKRRIAEGSGTTTGDVNKLLNQYDKMKKLMKQFSSMKGMFGL